MFEYQATIHDAYDGDTVHAAIDLGFGVWIIGGSVGGDRYRLARINAPELHALGGAASRAYLLTLLGPLPAVFVVNTIKDEKDNYGRYLVEITTHDGRNVSDEMVAAGFAVPYP